MTRNSTTIESAAPTDVPLITAMVQAAYTKYISRIRRPPAPIISMTVDYDAILTDSHQEIYVLRATDTTTLSPSQQSAVTAVVGSIVVCREGQA